MQATLMIKDLPVSEQLDRKGMSAIRGGSAIAGVGGNSGNVFGGGGFASPTIGVQVGPIVTTTDASQHLNISIPTIQNFGGYQLSGL
ncbi:hypothetical protein [Paraburkholderia phenazinium]|jgi:hypothetical protein|uniref:Uncharacterized protein n=1 Tax=Paraburkholderia phenazinium TaxID=60549 RepID=A0A1G7RWU7_9BURK|nr:hypothetical protein [Paraburkholderia phenazinium]SDG15222.1 hypothetical protein SAMN05216466_102294 [Paraburkholderia phenazinium]